MTVELCTPAWRGCPEAETMGPVTAEPSLLSRILQWLRAGYPEGIPGPDRVPLLALLRSAPLTEDQLREIVRNITSPESEALDDGQIDQDEIEAFVKDVTHHDAGPENVRRVAAILAAAGWPLAGLDEPAAH
jgi:hypothetical protein